MTQTCSSRHWVKRDGATSEVHATMAVTEVGGAFLVLNAPKLPGCSQAIARAMLLAERAHRPNEHTVSTCLRDKWSTAAIECVGQALDLDAVRGCLERR